MLLVLYVWVLGGSQSCNAPSSKCLHMHADGWCPHAVPHYEMMLVIKTFPSPQQQYASFPPQAA